MNLPEEKEAIERAHEAIEPLRKNFLDNLKKELAAKPAQKCLRDCKLGKPALKNAVIVGHGRTSHKLRNPANAPKAWVKPYLEQYQKGPAGSQPNHVLVKLSKDHFGYLEPLYVEPVCLSCHGKSISGPVEETLHAYYPNDEASGFEIGDFRGFIWMEMKIKR